MESLEPKDKQRVEKTDDQTLVLTEPVPADNVVVAERPEHGQSILQAIVMIIGAVILVFLLVLFARWIYHKVHNGQSNTAGTAQVQQQSSNSNSNNKSGTGQPGGTNSPSQGSSPAPSPSSTSQNKTLANTGPGNIAAIFAGSTLAAAGLHYIISLRRFSKYGG